MRSMISAMNDRVLADTSVWISWFRQVSTPVAAELKQLLSSERVVLTDPVRMELLMGVPRLGELRLQRDLSSLEMVRVDPEVDFDLAAEIYRAVRRSGHTIRSSNDLLIAAVAIRTDLPLLHADKDFDRVSAVLPELRIWPVRSGE